jgi:hypothetical protein
MEFTAASDGTSNVFAWAQAPDAQITAITAVPDLIKALRAIRLIALPSMAATFFA